MKERANRDCEEIRAALGSYLDGESTAAQAAKVENHLASCVSCRAEVQLLRLGQQAVRSMPRLSLSEETIRRVVARVEAEVSAPQQEIQRETWNGERHTSRRERRPLPSIQRRTATEEDSVAVVRQERRYYINGRLVYETRRVA